MEQNIYELATPFEGNTHIKVTKLADSSPETHVVGDFGIYIEVEGELQFEAQYTNAVVLKTSIIDYQPIMDVL